MPPDPASLRFFVDESALGIGKVLTIARRDCIHAGHPLIPEVPYGTLDPDWMPTIAEKGLIVVARDKHIRTKPGELRLLRDQGLRVFWIAGPKDLSTWDYVVRMVRRWADIEDAIATKGPGPWFVAITDAKLTDISV